MERRLRRRMSGLSLQRRLVDILADLLHRQELAHHLKPDADRLTELSERVQEVRTAILSQTEEKYAGATVNLQAQAMDRAWRLSSYLRNLLLGKGRFGAASRAQVRTDLAALTSVAQMGSWQPQYVELDPSQERLAETILKLEREIHQTKRPHQLAKRDVFIRIGEPIDLGRFIPDYLRDARAVRQSVAVQLRDMIQSLIDNTVVAPPARLEGRQEVTSGENQ